MKGPFKDRILLLAFLVVLVVFGVLLARKYMIAPPQAPPPTAATQPPQQLRDVILYFGAQDGTHLVAEGREIEDCMNDADCLKETVRALVNGPVGDLVPLFPSHTVVRNVTEKGETAEVDFNRDLISGFPAGSSTELLTVYGLADTLAANFPHIRRVRILVDGHPVNTLKGHVDLRQPVQADFDYTRSREGQKPSGEAVPAGSPGATGTPSQPAPSNGSPASAENP